MGSGADFGEHDSAESTVPLLPRVLIRLTRCFLPLLLAAALTYLPSYTGLTIEGRAALFTFFGAMGLWFCRALPSPAVALLLLGWILVVFDFSGSPAHSIATQKGPLSGFLETPQISMICMYVAGLLMAATVQRCELVEVTIRWTLERVGERPWWILACCMGVVFFYSALSLGRIHSITVLMLFTPVIQSLAGGDPLRSSLTIGVLWAMHLGEIALIIGAPVNIAVAMQSSGYSGNPMGGWVISALIPAILLLLLCWGLLLFRYPAWVERIAFHRTPLEFQFEETEIAKWRRNMVAITIVATLVVWGFAPLHSMVILVASILAIISLLFCGGLRWEAIRLFPWDACLVLLVSLSFGWVATNTGLVDWTQGCIGARLLDGLWATLAFGYFGWSLALVVPRIAVAALLAPFCSIIAPSTPLVAPVALAIALATAVPISMPDLQTLALRKAWTPKPIEYLLLGIWLGITGPIIAWLWGAILLPSDLSFLNG